MLHNATSPAERHTTRHFIAPRQLRHACAARPEQRACEGTPGTQGPRVPQSSPSLSLTLAPTAHLLRVNAIRYHSSRCFQPTRRGTQTLLSTLTRVAPCRTARARGPRAAAGAAVALHVSRSSSDRGESRHFRKGDPVSSLELISHVIYKWNRENGRSRGTRVCVRLALLLSIYDLVFFAFR